MSYITTRDNVKLYLKDWGKGRPVVMMHGWPLSSDTFDDLSMARVRVPWPQQPDEAATFALARQTGGAHELWFATLRSGIYRLRGGAWTHFIAQGAQAPWTVLGLAEQRAGRPARQKRQEPHGARQARIT